MSDFVQFPEETYTQAGNVFAGFDPEKQVYSPENARSLMWFAQLAYEVDNTGGETMTPLLAKLRDLWEFDSVTPFRRQAAAFGGAYNTTGAIGERAGAVILTFAGTDVFAWETVATDSQLALDKDADVHKGFLAALKPVMSFVDDAITLSGKTKKPLFISGHSLGASLGIMSAFHAVTERKHAPRALYGYGTPRTGGAKFNAAYDPLLGDVTYRHVHGRDLISRVPMSFLGYRHVGRVIRIPTNAKFSSASLSPDRPNTPDFDLDTLKSLVSAVDPAKFGPLISQILLGQIQVPQDLPKVLKELLQPPGHDPLGQTFRLIPPAIREHLQDQYINALT